MNNEMLFAVDLFSGAGGLSLGFLQTKKIQVIAAVENNKYAQMTYQKNHNEVKLFDDIRDVDYDEILYRCKELGKEQVDIVIGGPPCQGFSNANRQKTELISSNNQLVKQFAKAIERLRPKAFVMENVKTMKSKVHKFFRTFDDKEIDILGLEYKREKIFLGKKTSLSNELLKYLKIHEHKSLESFIISDKSLFSKLCHLVRKEKEFEKYLLKNKSAFLRYLNEWDNVHPEYWSDAYYHVWNDIMQEIRRYISYVPYSREKLINSLVEVIEVQKILHRINEINLNNVIVFNIDSNNREIFVELETYGVLDYLTAKFKSLGYEINEDQLILNAADFGAPQLRERLFLIGIQKEYIQGRKVELPKPLLRFNEYNTVRKAIADLENIEPLKTMSGEPIPRGKVAAREPLRKYLEINTPYVFNHIVTDTTETALQRFKLLNPGENFHHLDEAYKTTYTDPNRTQNTVYLRLKYDSPSGTVLNVRKSMWIHPVLNRAISIREAARLQTFPDTFVFMGTKDAQYQQIGNAVPPILGRAVAEKVLDYLGINVEEKLSSLILATSEEELISSK